MTETSAAEAAKRLRAFLDATTDAVPAVRPEASIADLRALLAEREQLHDAVPDPETETEACVCGNEQCAPYWWPVHQRMLEMQVRNDQNNAEFTMTLLEEICEQRTRAEQAEADRDTYRKMAATAQLLADQYGAQLAETREKLGDLTAEWGTRGARNEIDKFGTNEAWARRDADHDHPLVSRFVGEWRDADATEADHG